MPDKKIAPLIGVINMRTQETEQQIVATGTCVVKLIGKREYIDTDQIRLDITVKENAAKLTFGSRYGKKLPGGYSLNTFRIEIDKVEATDFDIQNKLVPVYKDEYRGRFLYSVFDLKKGHNRNREIFVNDGVAMYFRQTPFNTMGFTVRDSNIYDSPEGQKRLKQARKNAKQLKDKDIILMYEKDCSRYEESASVLYEKLIDLGYDNVYFIVDTSIPAVAALDEKYKKNLIEKDSDKHLEYFFACEKFISSETIDHALQLRIASKDVHDKINGKGLSYVFLQHGVMYMVSLSSKLRSGFRKKEGYKLQRTVVSSEAEANHFIELAGMSREDLYVTGLAKFDTSYRNDNAEKIIIMPTWRRWETNQAKHDIKHTGYYKMIERMYNSVPDALKDKVVILPHPLMIERFKDEKDGVGGHLLIADSYDKVLRDCDMLITDYSSIAYDAYYRGANVAFWWDEKDECMQYYGEEAYLMLNEGNTFGPVCMNESDLTDAINELYGKPQRSDDLEKYRKIVEFHDGRNSERIIEHLRKDGVI